MSIKSKIAGIVLMIAGAAVWSIDYFILKAIASIGTMACGTDERTSGSRNGNNNNNCFSVTWRSYLSGIYRCYRILVGSLCYGGKVIWNSRDTSR